MIQLLAGSFFILLCGGFAQRSPIDTSVPIVRISPPLKNNGSNDSDSFGFAIAFYQLDPVLSTNLASWRLVLALTHAHTYTSCTLSLYTLSNFTIPQARSWSSQRYLPGGPLPK